MDKKAKITEIILKENRFETFNPMQAEALKKDLFEKSLLISAPTSSGKTVIAEMLALNTVVNKGGKTLYIAPLKALAAEHYKEFKKKYEKYGLNAALSTGDLDSGSKYLSKYNVIFLTTEKLDSLLRHEAAWLEDTKLLIADEIHELDSSRGPTLEIVIAKMMSINSSLQVLGLSATINNSDEIAEWLNAELIKSDYRPVKLSEGTYYDGLIYDKDYKKEEINEDGEPIDALMNFVLKKEKQMLCFVNSRKRTMTLAEKLGKVVGKKLSEEERKELKKIAEEVINVLESPTEQCIKLAGCVERGSAFHHAGLMPKQKELVEENFKNKKIKSISATPTLSMGINLPAYMVVVRDLHRFTAQGMQKIPVREYKQMIGRAGRTGFDEEGMGITIAKDEVQLDQIIEEFVDGEIENVESKLGFEPVLRMHLLGLIATDFVFNIQSMEDFFSKTFYAKQFGDLGSLMLKLQDILKQLEEFGFVEFTNERKKFEATIIGRRIAELYLDPVSGNKLIKSLQKKVSGFGLLYSLAELNEFAPWFNVGKRIEQDVFLELNEKAHELAVDVMEVQYTDYNLLEKFYSSKVMNEWISEVREEKIINEYDVLPGILFNKSKILDWLAYSAIELAKLMEIKEMIRPYAVLRKRVLYGIKEELVELVELKGIGRVRARKLFNAGIKGIADVKKADVKDLGLMIGNSVAFNIKKQLRQI